MAIIMWNRLLFLCFLFVFLCNSLGWLWSSRYFVQNRPRSHIKCSSIHGSPNSKEFVQKRDLTIASYFKHPTSIPALLSIMGEFSLRSDSQRLIESYGVYLSLLTSQEAQEDDDSSFGMINLSPALHILTVLRRINPSKRLKLVQEVENLHSQYPSLPHTKITSSLLFNHRRQANNCSSLTSLPPRLYQALREAAWFGNSFKHTLLVIKRLRNLRLRKIDSRPSRTFYYRSHSASNNGITTGVSVRFYSQLRYFEMCALFVAIKQDMQVVLSSSLLDYDDSFISTSSANHDDDVGGDDAICGGLVGIDGTQHDSDYDDSISTSTSINSGSSVSDMLLPHGWAVWFVLEQLLLSSTSSSSSFKVLPTTTTNVDDTNTTTTYSVLQHEEAFATVERFLQQYIHLHHIPQPPLHTTSSTSSTSSSSRLPPSSRTIIAEDASTSSNRRRAITSKNEAVLVVGEGDFTFTNALLSSYSPSRSIVSTCLEKLSGRKLQEALRLTRNYPVHLTVLDEIDACNLLSSLSTSSATSKLPLGGRRFFDVIYFTFPYANTNHLRGLPPSMSNDTNNTLIAFDSHYLGIRRHTELLQSFLVSAKDVLAEHGEVVLMGLLSQWVAWELEHMLDMQGFVLSRAYGFDYELWRGRGYVPKRTHGLDSFVSKTQTKSSDNNTNTTSSSTSNGINSYPYYVADKDEEDVAYVVHLVRKKT